MYSSSTSSAYPSRRAAPPPSSVMSSRRRDERTANGPLTSERAMMEQIRSKLEKTQRRLARDHARTASQHGYNSSSGAAMGSMPGMSSSRAYQHHASSSRTVASSRTNVHSHVGSPHYFPPDYRSARAPAVRSVYLEDLGMGIHASQRTAPSSRVPTSYAPGDGGRGGLRGSPPSNASSYYAPSVDERATRRHHYHHQHAYSERRGEDDHRQHQHNSVSGQSKSHHHHHQPHESRSSRHVAGEFAPSATHRPPPERSTSREAPPTSLRGILRTSSSSSSSTPPPPSSSSFVSSNMLHYQPPSSKQRLNGQSERTNTRYEPSYTEYFIDENDDDDDEVPPPPPSSRVRFQDELPTEPPLSSLPLVEEDEEESEDEDTRHMHRHGRFEPMIQVRRTAAAPTQHTEEKSGETTPTRKTKNVMPTSPVGEKDPHPRRRRGSSASRATPPTRSPVGSAPTRKSLTSNPVPPKSDIDTSYFDQLELRPRRGSKDRRSSVDVGDVSGLVKLSSSPIEVTPAPEVIGTKKDADQVSENQAGEDSDDSAPSVPPADVLSLNVTTRDSAKSSPSSTNEYIDARAFGEEDEIDSDDQVKAAVIVATNSNEAEAPSVSHSDASETHKAKPKVMNFWELPMESDNSDGEGEREPASCTFDDDYDIDSSPFHSQEPTSPLASASGSSPPSSPGSPPPPSSMIPRRSTAASAVAANLAPSRRHHHDRPSTKRHPVPLSQTMMLIPPPPPTSTAASHRPPPSSTYIRPSPGTDRSSITSRSSITAVPRAPITAEPGSTYVPRRLRPKRQVSQLRKTLPPSIGALSGLASGPVTFELHEESFYEVIWQSGEFGFSFQRVYLEDAYDSDDDDFYSGTAPRFRRMFLRMLLNTERGTCPCFKQVHVGDVLIQVGDTRVCDLQLDHQTALTKFFTQLRDKTPLRLVFQRMDPMSWEGGVEL